MVFFSLTNVPDTPRPCGKEPIRRAVSSSSPSWMKSLSTPWGPRTPSAAYLAPVTTRASVDQTAEDSIEVDFAYHPCSGTDQIGEAFDLYCGGHL